MDHDPWRAVKLGYQVSANETSLSEAVYKFRSTELSIQDSLDLTVYRLRDICLCACLACIRNSSGFCSRQAVSIVKRRILTDIKTAIRDPPLECGTEKT
jgi:hypothetical protein